jgi:hypothetical protein
MACLTAVPDCIVKNVRGGIPMCYDISDQVIPAYGRYIVTRDLESVSGLESEGRWSGGEFLTGTPGFFSVLMEEIDRVYPRYLERIGSLFHVGDEIVVSAALERVRKNGTYVADAGTLGIVGRFWNADLAHPQKPFDYFQRCFLVHLPADKEFLAYIATKDLSGISFAKEYTAYLRSARNVLKGIARFARRRLRRR